jgi:hypothetical protein
MLGRLDGRRILWPACLLLFVGCLSAAAAEPASSKIVYRADLAPARRQQLAEQLRAITGWPGLHFDHEGFLRFGDEQPVGGSQTARELLAAAQAGKNLIIIEDASGSAEVVFCRVVEGRWKNGAEGKPAAFVLQIDFADFSQVMGDREARAAFNAGWGLLHEIDHVVHDSVDPEGPGAAGECEQLVNRMRRECGLAERADYFYTPVPGAQDGDFKTRYVRLAFEREQPQSRRRRYWLFWDAEVVGGPLAAT